MDRLVSTVWFTSDLHIGHALVAVDRLTRSCGYDASGAPGYAVEWHDNLLAENWDSRVQPDDQVWVLGDLSAGGAAAESGALSWIRQRPGWKHLVPGNHDRCHPMYRDSHKHIGEFLLEFESVQPFARRRIRGATVLLSHFPYQGDHTEVSRFDQYRLRDYGDLLLHGHTHSTEKTSWGAKRVGDFPTQIHVGVDAWGLRPVHIDELAELIREHAAGRQW